MSTFTQSDPSFLKIPTPITRIYIDGALREDIVAVSLRDQAGVLPAELVLNIPDAEFNQENVYRGQMVRFEVFRDYGDSGTSRRRFMGQIVDLQDRYSIAPGLGIICHDYRTFLQRDKIRRIYNAVSTATRRIDEYPAPKTIYDVVNDALTSFRSRAVSDANPHLEYLQLGIDISNLPTVMPPGEVQMVGQPIADMLEWAAKTAMGDLYNWIMTYDDWTPTLRLVSFNKDAASNTRAKHFYYPTDPSLSISKQQGGLSSVTEITHQSNQDSACTRTILLGDYIREQRLIRLAPAWTIPRNKWCIAIEGYYYNDIPADGEDNPRKLQEWPITALFLNAPDRFLRQTIGGGNPFLNPNYTPLMDQIGKVYEVRPHLMMDQAKTDDHLFIEHNADAGDGSFAGKYLTCIDDGTIPEGDAVFNYCTFKVPATESDTLTVPPRLDTYRTDTNYFADSATISQPFLLYRYKTDYEWVQRVSSMKTLSTTHYFDLSLLWNMKSDGVSTDKARTNLDKRLDRKQTLYNFATTFPAEDVSYDDPNQNNRMNPHYVYKPLICQYATGEGCSCSWNATDGIVSIDITTDQILKMLDDIMFGVGNTPAKHYLELFGVQPDYWMVDNSSPSTDPAVPRPIVSTPGTYTQLLAAAHSWIGEVGGDQYTTVYSYYANGSPPDYDPGQPYVRKPLTDLMQYAFFELPVEVYMNATVIDSRRVVLDTGKVDDGIIDKIEVKENMEYKKIRLGPGCFYTIDYRSDLLDAGDDINDIATVNEFTGIGFMGAATVLTQLDATTYPAGYTIRDDSASIRQQNPPPGILHLGEVLSTNTVNVPEESLMGREAFTDVARRIVGAQSYSMTLERMDLSANPGDMALINNGEIGDNLCIMEVSETYYAGDPTSTNTTSITIAKI